MHAMRRLRECARAIRRSLLTGARVPDAVENARIMESVKNETESDDKDLSPDGLVYNVSNFELEVERYLTPNCSARCRRCAIFNL